MIKFIPILALLLGLSACTTGPDYQRPETFDQVQWNQTLPDGLPTDEVDKAWWTQFGDPLLVDLLERAVSGNRDLRAAEARVQRSRALRRETASERYPQLDATGSALRQRTAAEADGGSANTRTRYDAGLGASWEIDLFGRTRREVEAGQARMEFSLEQRRGILLGVVTEVARGYYDVRGLQKRIAIVEKNIELQTRTFELVQQLRKLGESSEFDLIRARGQLQLTRSRLPDLNASLQSGIHRLSVLTGELPSALYDEMAKPGTLPAPPELLPVGQLSDIIRRRPDIRAAERELAASTADVGAVQAERFPRFVLLGSVGRAGNSLSSLSDSSQTRYSFGPRLDWPLLQGGDVKARIEGEKAELTEAVARYEQTLLEAFEDVESALVRYLREREKNELLREALTSQELSVGLARNLYNAGEEDFLSVLAAERELINVEDQYVTSETLAVSRLITLFSALGGGWEVFEEPPGLGE
jgi:multidrug efflux system outer membrane protein